jgi:hypothetical protein
MRVLPALVPRLCLVTHCPAGSAGIPEARAVCVTVYCFDIRRLPLLLP